MGAVQGMLSAWLLLSFLSFTLGSAKMTNDSLSTLPFTRFRRSLEDVQQEEEQMEVGDVLQYTAQEIDARNYVKASKEYLKLKDIQTPLPDLVKIAYKPENIEKILKFSNHLPWLLLRGIVAEYVVREMKAQNQLDDPMVLVVSDYGADLWGITNDPRVKAESKHIFKFIEHELKFPVQAVTNKFAKQIKTGDFNDTLKFAKYFERHLPRRAELLIQQAYSPDEEVQTNLLDFIDKVSPNFAVKLIIELYNQMVGMDHISLKSILRLVQKVRILIDEDRVYGSNLVNLKILWSGLPEHLRALVSSGFVLQKFGAGSFYYLYGKPSDSQSDNIAIVTTRPKNKPGKWVLESVPGHSHRYRIRAKEGYLYAGNLTYDDERRKVYVGGKNGTDSIGDQWEIQEVDWKSNKFYVYNVFYKEYLDVGEVDGIIPLDKGFVHTWRNGIAGKYPAWSVHLAEVKEKEEEEYEDLK